MGLRKQRLADYPYFLRPFKVAGANRESSMLFLSPQKACFKA